MDNSAEGRLWGTWCCTNSDMSCLPLNLCVSQLTLSVSGSHCHWRECSSDIDGEASCYLRHVYFHLFHVKIKSIGSLLLQKTGRQPCLYDIQSRNMIPELPECLQCGWQDCHVCHCRILYKMYQAILKINWFVDMQYTHKKLATQFFFSCAMNYFFWSSSFIDGLKMAYLPADIALGCLTANQ